MYADHIKMPKFLVTTYNDKYTEEFDWVEKDPKFKINAVYNLCNIKIIIVSMGRLALVSHANGAKNVFFMTNKKKSPPLDVFIKKQDTEHVISTTAMSHSSAGPTGIAKFLLNDGTSKVEILWSVAIVMIHLSFSLTAQLLVKFSFRELLAYLIVNGVAPHFREKLANTQKTCEHLVIAVDETLNKVLQRQQMDIDVEFWNDANLEVTSMYVTSAFLNHTHASDLLHSLQELVCSQFLKKQYKSQWMGPMLT
ncbi:hypothetical protein PR048_018636 [Dryococelus australis]|uniref:Uncharacterized protein n=1 Tax=Dryococelus australis TaxID=614101 RepID=A0ABQ9HCW6_9NEOP|nr:hypothetical protein PR048_018636 [Dryococelus australis]